MRFLSSMKMEIKFLVFIIKPILKLLFEQTSGEDLALILVDLINQITNR
jgi:hypothetical protein